MNGTIKSIAGSIQLLRKAVAMGASAAALLILAAPAQADLITNGGFESTTNGPGQLGYNTNATDWTVAPGGYTFLYAPGTADTSSAPIGQYGVNPLWGPASPADGAGPTASDMPAASPDGGNFVALDGDFQIAALSQTINDLIAGDQYTVGFYWAAAQQWNFDGPTVQAMNVCLGSSPESYNVLNTGSEQLSGGTNASSNLNCNGSGASTPTVSLPSHGFSGWEYETVNLTANSPTEVLSFLAYGNVQVPPFALLDGVTMDPTPTPEPATLPLLVTGLMGGLSILRSRKWLKR